MRSFLALILFLILSPFSVAAQSDLPSPGTLEQRRHQNASEAEKWMEAQRIKLTPYQGRVYWVRSISTRRPITFIQTKSPPDPKRKYLFTVSRPERFKVIGVDEANSSKYQLPSELLVRFDDGVEASVHPLEIDLSLYNPKSKDLEAEFQFKAITTDDPEPIRRRLAKKAGVRIGMTKDQVLESSWGKPSHVNRTHTAAGTTEQWVYGNGGYLYFSNGVLDTIQN